MKRWIRAAGLITGLGLAGALSAAIAVLISYLYVLPVLPGVDSLRDVRMQVPLRVYTRDGRLMAEFGERRRVPVEFDEIPDQIVNAFLAAEDDRFFDHPGVDYQGLMRAVYVMLMQGQRQGGSTITMQLARNMFLTPEQTYVRKIKEIYLALKIEREFSKSEILTLYLNKIFLGQRAYGIGAAAEVYYGKALHELKLAEIATIAGLPKAPSTTNPVSSPQRAGERRAYVLRRMHELGFIRDLEMEAALAETIATTYHGPIVEIDAPYVAELARVAAVERVGDRAMTEGYKVTTTLDSRLQQYAQRALRIGLVEYEQRHGFKGPIAKLEALPKPEDAIAWNQSLADFTPVGNLLPAAVTKVEEKTADLYVREFGPVSLDWAALEWARPFIDQDRVGDEPEKISDILTVGDLVYASRDANNAWTLAQYPDVQGALVAIDPTDGALVATTGGFDFSISKFNRAVQAIRQPGSSFKPFIYSAALENGFTLASIVDDAPVVFHDDALEETWRPDNYGRRFHGPTRVREALVRSRNLVSIRMLRSIGVRAAYEHLLPFGFLESELAPDLSLALGSATMTPEKLASGYAVFANGGYRIEPYYIDRIEDSEGKAIFEANPLVVCEACEQPTEDEPAKPGAPRIAPRVLSEQNAYLVVDAMRDVIRRGTGSRAMELGREDLAGKTGTTNDLHDTWFSGFNRDLVVTAWVGFDQDRSLGSGEQGGRTALPVWKYFMGAALDGMPEREYPEPPGLTRVRISPDTGLLARADNPSAIFEVFREDNVPPLEEQTEEIDLIDFVSTEILIEEEDEDVEEDNSLF